MPKKLPGRADIFFAGLWRDQLHELLVEAIEYGRDSDHYVPLGEAADALFGELGRNFPQLLERTPAKEIFEAGWTARHKRTSKDPPNPEAIVQDFYWYDRQRWGEGK